MNFIRARLRSITFAAAGIAYLLRTQRNAWVHAAATLLVACSALVLRVRLADGCWLLVAIAAVWVAEALNTAVELLADAACPHWHPLVGRAKDVAAGSVLLAALGAAGVGTCVFVPPLLALLARH